MEEEEHLLSPDVLTVSSPHPSSGRESDSIQIQDIQSTLPRKEKKICKFVTKALTAPVGIVRILQVIFTCISFSLVASLGHSTFYLWTWCMFIWGFCLCVTLFILLLEFTSLSTKLPIFWEDFTFAFTMLGTLMVLTATISYQDSFVYSENSKWMCATVTSCLACMLYAFKAWQTHIKSGQIHGCLSTVLCFPKVLEACVAFMIFIRLDNRHYSEFPGLQWCVAVYSICFIFTIIIIVSIIGRIQSLFPALFYKVLTVCNVLAVLMYITAVVIWPLYSFQNEPWPSHCRALDHLEDECVPVSIFQLTCINLVLYVLDTFYLLIQVCFSLISTACSGNL